MSRRHPIHERVDRIFAIQELLKIMPLDHPNRPEMEQLLRQLEETNLVDNPTP